MCSAQLFAWQECTVGSVQDMMLLLDPSGSEQPQEERERDAAQFLHLLRELQFSDHYVGGPMVIGVLTHSHAESLGSDNCKRAASLLVCQSMFPLCDCKSGRSYLASREECERISLVECEEEWTSAKQYGIPLPNCTDLPGEVTSKRTV